MGGTDNGGRARAAISNLIREELALGDEFMDALAARSAPSLTDEEVARAEGRASDLLHDLLRLGSFIHRQCVANGIHPDSIPSLYAEEVGDRELDGPLGGMGLGWGTAFAGREPLGQDWLRSVRAGSVPALSLYALLATEELAAEEEIHPYDCMNRAAVAGYAPAIVAICNRLTQFGGDEERAEARAMLEKVPVDLSPAAALLLAECRLADAEDEAEVARARDLVRLAADAGDRDAILLAARFAAGHAMEDASEFAEARTRVADAARLGSPEAIAWIARYGDLTAEQYRRVAVADAWLPDELPPPERSGRLSIVLSTAFVVALIVATFMGNSLGPFLLLLFAAVVLHELGHMLAGRLVGVPTALFTVGLGPVLFSRTVRMDGLPMRIDVRLLPLLGSVRPYILPRSLWEYWRETRRAHRTGAAPPDPPVVDENAEPEPVSEFPTRPARLFFYSGGLIANVLLALVCLAAVQLGSERATTVVAPVLGPIAADSVAADAELQEFDRIVAIDGEPVVSFRDVRDPLTGAEERESATPPTLTVEREGECIEIDWPLLEAPPKPSDRDAWGVRPQRTWTVARSTSELVPPGAVIRGFDTADGWVETGPTVSYGLLEHAFENALPRRRAERAARMAARPGESEYERLTRVSAYPAFLGPLTVEVEVSYDGVTERRDVLTQAGRDGEAEVAPFQFELLRARDPDKTYVRAVGGLFSTTLEACLELPRTLIQAAVEAPTPNEQRALLDAVSSDAWAVFLLFAFVNAFLFFLNLLPIPPLDGFHLAVVSIEGLIGTELPRPLMGAVLRVGWVLLLLWIVANVLLVLRDLAVTFT